MAKKKIPEAQHPLILRSTRLVDAFAKSDDERDFYLDRAEGFIIFVDLEKNQNDLDALELELAVNTDRYCPIPKLTFYESKKIMEGFVNEKVYDIDTKEKLLDIIQQKGARDTFLEFLHDQHTELEKWQQYYQERSRVRLIEWLRNEEFSFVFEEDLDLTTPLVEKLKKSLFDTKVPRDVASARKTLASKAATYYSNEALNPRPKRGRPPKQAAKVEVETVITDDFYSAVPSPAQSFLYVPDITTLSSVTFSARFDSEQELLDFMRSSKQEGSHKLDELSKKLASLRTLTAKAAAARQKQPEVTE